MEPQFGFLLTVSLSCILNTVSSADLTAYQPKQVHISFGDSISDIVVTWVTFSKTRNSLVEYGVNGLIDKAEGKQTVFQDGGKEKRKFYIHRVVLPNLEENTTYEYHCGSDFGWSNLFSFHTPPKGVNWSPSFALYGDMGAVNAQSLPRLQRDTQMGMYDTIFHVGDMAYDMYSDNGRVGDMFMEQIEPIAAYVPYMTAVGNHEEKYNFSHYRLRFSMPGKSQGLFYSINIGPVHFIIISTEVYYFNVEYGSEPLINQYEWLKKDLKEATLPENRAQRPWIITMGHRPMYCSNEDRDDCTYKTDRVRIGMPPMGTYGIEDLLYKHGVDVEIWAHEHSYERTWPLYNYKIYNGSEGSPYVNPKAPIHVVTGSAGCKEYVDHFKKKPSDWSASRSSDYGFTRMKAYNKTHLHFQQVSDDKNGQIVDEFWIVKDSDKPYPRFDMTKLRKKSDIVREFFEKSMRIIVESI